MNLTPSLKTRESLILTFRCQSLWTPFWSSLKTMSLSTISGWKNKTYWRLPASGSEASRKASLRRETSRSSEKTSMGKVCSSADTLHLKILRLMCTTRDQRLGMMFMLLTRQPDSYLSFPRWRTTKLSQVSSQTSGAHHRNSWISVRVMWKSTPSSCATISTLLIRTRARSTNPT